MGISMYACSQSSAMLVKLTFSISELDNTGCSWLLELGRTFFLPNPGSLRNVLACLNCGTGNSPTPEYTRGLGQACSFWDPEWKNTTPLGWHLGYGNERVLFLSFARMASSDSHQTVLATGVEELLLQHPLNMSSARADLLAKRRIYSPVQQWRPYSRYAVRVSCT